MFNIAIIGCGLIGQKRAKAIEQLRAAGENIALVACVDTLFEKADALTAKHPGATAFTQWEEVLQREDIHIIIVATPHDSLALIGLRAILAGKQVFLEKPAGRNRSELNALMEACQSHAPKLRVGFNHRFHRAFRKARALVDQGDLGDLMFIRARYGHGGRVGYHNEWRANKELSGGGELIDQGIHLIDLARWFLGEFTDIQGQVHTFFWDMPVDDNSFLTLKTSKNQVAFLHASCTEWKNLFSFEIYGKKGKIDIQGLGGSYGVERITFYQMSEQMGPPETFAWEYPMADDSFEYEFAEFLADIRLDRPPSPGIHDACQALHIVDEVYRMSPL